MKRKIISLILALIFALTPIVPYDAEDEQVLYATNIAPNTRASVLEDATIFRGDYKLTDSDYIATGDVIIKDGIEYTSVVLGDVNGDRLINSTDFMRLRRAYLSLYTFEGANYKAADVNGDGIINSTSEVTDSIFAVTCIFLLSTTLPYLSNILLPRLSTATIKGRFSISIFLTDSQPKSS